MTAVTVNEAYDNTLNNEGAMRIAYLSGGPLYTYTPTNSSGKTIRVISTFNNSSGTALVPTSVSSGVMTFDEGQSGALVLGQNFTVMYTLV